tara:strand:+ start:4405 stop:4971 length:567 start_codon:yes stop_codon:yes gene_type:complete
MDITSEIVRELLHYDPETGIFTWRARDRRWFKSEHSCMAWNAKHANKRAGCVWTSPRTGFKRRHIALFRKTRLEHALAWMWMSDEPLPAQIDHENRDGTDNRWQNIRASNNAKNCLNRSKRFTNKSGVTGVDWHGRLGKWRARCTVSGKTHHLGVFNDINEAESAVIAFRASHGFELDHGAELAHYHQ